MENHSIKKSQIPTIYISLGTVLNENVSFYTNCIEAFTDRDIHVIMSVGEDLDITNLGKIPKNFRVEHSVNQLEVLQQVHTFITYCGMNSVSEALYYKVPLILFPQTPEESDVACRVKELGAGIYLKNNSKEAIITAVKEILENHIY